MKLRILCVMLVCAVVSSASAQPPLADRAPARWAFYLGWSGRTIPFEGSMLGQLLNEPAVNSMFAAINQAAVDGLHDPMQQEVFERSWSMCSIAWQHPVAVTGDVVVRDGEHVPQAALLIDVGRDKPQFAENLDALVDALGDQFQFEQASVAGVSFRTVQVDDNLRLSFGFMEEVFFAYIGPDGPAEIIELDADSSLAAAESFQQRMAAVNGEDVQLAFHVDVQALAERLGPSWHEDTGTDLAKLLTAAGLDQVSAVAGTTRVVDRGMYTRSRIFSPAPHRGLLSLLAGAELADGDLAAVPDDADYVWAGNISLENVYTELQRCLNEYDAELAAEFGRGVEEFESNTELSLQADVLAPMGETWVLASAPSYGGFLTGTVLTVDLDDAERFAQSLKVLEEQVQGLLGDSGGRLLTTSADRTEIRYLAIGNRGFFLPVAPAWGAGKEKLYIAAWPQVIEAAVAGTGRRPLTESPEFISAREKIQGNPSMLSYTNTPKILRQTYQWWLFGWTTGANALSGMAGVQAKPDWLPALPTLQKYFRPQISAVSADDEGITFESYGSLPGAGVVGSSLASPLTAAAVLPVLGRARASARRVASQTNLRGIGMAMHMHAADNRESFPPDMQTLVEDGYVSEKMLVSPARDDVLPDGESDYVYPWPGLRLSEIPNSSEFVLVYERPENYDGKGTNVLFADGHIAWMKQEEFDQALRRTEQAVEEIKGPEDF